MTTPQKSEGPEVAASEPSEPTTSNEQIGNHIMAHSPDNPFPVDATGPLTIGSIPDEDLDALIAATKPAEQPYTYSDALFPEDTATVRIKKFYRFDPEVDPPHRCKPRTFVRIGVNTVDDEEDNVFDAAVLLDAGTAVVMALDILGAAAQVMHADPGPFRRMTQADHAAADAAIRTRREWADQ